MLFAIDRHSDDIIVINGSTLFIYSKTSNCLVSRTTLPYVATSIMQIQTHLVIATESGHVADFTQTPLKFREISDLPIISLHADNGKMYAATALNLIQFDVEKFTYQSVLEFPAANTNLVYLRNQRLFAVDKTTVHCYNAEEGHFKGTGDIQLNSPALQFQVSRKTLIIATEDAVELFDLFTQQFIKALKKSGGLSILLINQLQEYTILSGYNAHDKSIIFYDLTSVDSIFKIRCSQAIGFYKYTGQQLDDCRLTVIFGDQIPQFKSVDLQINKGKVFNLSLTEQMLGITQPVKVRQQLGDLAAESDGAMLQTDLSELEQALLQKDYESADDILQRKDFDACERIRPDNMNMLVDFLVRGTNYSRLKALRRIVDGGYTLSPDERAQLKYGRMCFLEMKEILDQFEKIATENFVVGELEPAEELETW